MNDHGIAYMGYLTHDPDEAMSKYKETVWKNPTIILIRPGYPVTKDHPLLLETGFCGANMMMVSGDIDVIGYKEIFKNKEHKRRQRKILEGKKLREIQANERELDGAHQNDSDQNLNGQDQITEPVLPQEWIERQSPRVMTDVEYLKLVERRGFVYLLSSDNGYHKIGRSFDVEDRRVQLEREIPVVIGIEHYFATKYYIAAEAYMHNKFSKYRTGRYEWFRLRKNHIDDFKSVEDFGLDNKLEKILLKRR